MQVCFCLFLSIAALLSYAWNIVAVKLTTEKAEKLTKLRSWHIDISLQMEDFGELSPLILFWENKHHYCATITCSFEVLGVWEFREIFWALRWSKTTDEVVCIENNNEVGILNFFPKKSTKQILLPPRSCDIYNPWKEVPVLSDGFPCVGVSRSA